MVSGLNTSRGRDSFVFPSLPDDSSQVKILPVVLSPMWSATDVETRQFLRRNKSAWNLNTALQPNEKLTFVIFSSNFFYIFYLFFNLPALSFFVLLFSFILVASNFLFLPLLVLLIIVSSSSSLLPYSSPTALFFHPLKLTRGNTKINLRHYSNSAQYSIASFFQIW